jgi:Predicted integral membrane protein
MSDPLLPLLLILRYMHILGAIMLMGGTIFMRCALAPTVAQLDPAARATLHEQLRSRWSKFVMLAAALLLISGVTNLALAVNYKFEPVFGLSYHMVVGIKLLLSLPIFFVASLLAGRSETARKFQANALTWMNFNLALALLMVAIGGVLKFVHRDLKPPKPQNASISRLDAICQQKPSIYPSG